MPGAIAEPLPTSLDHTKLELLTMLEATVQQNLKSANDSEEHDVPLGVRTCSDYVVTKPHGNTGKLKATYSANAYRPDPAGFAAFPNRMREGRFVLRAWVPHEEADMETHHGFLHELIGEVATEAGLKKRDYNRPNDSSTHPGEWGHAGANRHGSDDREFSSTLLFNLANLNAVAQAVTTLKDKYNAKCPSPPSADGLADGTDRSAERLKSHGNGLPK